MADEDLEWWAELQLEQGEKHLRGWVWGRDNETSRHTGAIKAAMLQAIEGKRPVDDVTEGIARLQRHLDFVESRLRAIARERERRARQRY